MHHMRRIAPDPREIEEAAEILKKAKKPFVVCGGGVLYSYAERQLIDFCASHGIPVGETQAGKSATPVDHPLAMGAVGVTGTGAANSLASQADVILGVGTRFADFTTGLLGVVQEPRSAIDQPQRPALRCGQASGFVCRRRRPDGACGARFQAPRLESAARLGRRSREGQGRMGDDRGPLYRADQRAGADRRRSARRPHVRAGEKSDVVVCASGGTAWRIAQAVAGGRAARLPSRIRLFVHGYEIAGGIGVKMALPDREVLVVLGDGSYLMMNSEIATSVIAWEKTHHRRQRQPRLWLHQPAAASDRGRAVQQPSARLCGTRRCRRSTSSPTRGRSGRKR